MSRGQIETSQSPSVSRPPILLYWNCTSPPTPLVWTLNPPLWRAYRTQGVVEHYRAIQNNLDESETIRWGAQAHREHNRRKHRTSSDGIPAFATQSSSSSGWAQQTDEEEISELHQHSSSNCCSHFAPGWGSQLTFVRRAFQFLTYHCWRPPCVKSHHAPKSFLLTPHSWHNCPCPNSQPTTF